MVGPATRRFGEATVARPRFLHGAHGQGRRINYEFVDMMVEVPKDTGPSAERATWKINGTLRITTSDSDHRS